MLEFYKYLFGDFMKQNKVTAAMAEYKRHFYGIYHKELLPYLIQFEEQRKRKLCKLVIGEFILMVIGIIGIKCIFSGEVSEGIKLYFHGILMLLGTASLIFMFICPYSANKNFCKLLKNHFRYKLCTAFGNMEWTQGDRGISDNALVLSDLFAVFNTRSCDDMFKGNVKGVNFTISETCLRQINKASRYNSVVTIFKGVIINFDVNKTVKNKTIITSKKDKNIRGTNLGIYTIIFSFGVQFAFSREFGLLILIMVGAVIYGLCSKLVSGKKEKLAEIKLEDAEFNRRYNVFSSDEIEGRYLVTPAFMERFKNLETAFGSKLSKCSFYGNSLMFAISTNKNLFEIGNLYHKLDDPKQFENFFNELSSILVLIDYFKLDEKTGI